MLASQNVSSLFKTISSIKLSNLFETKTELANVKRKLWKLGNITWGISPDISHFWLCHVTCLDQSRALEKNIWWIIMVNIPRDEQKTYITIFQKDEFYIVAKFQVTCIETWKVASRCTLWVALCPPCLILEDYDVIPYLSLLVVSEVYWSRLHSCHLCCRSLFYDWIRITWMLQI